MTGESAPATMAAVRWDRLATRMLLLLVVATMALSLAQRLGGFGSREIPLPSWAAPATDASGARLFSLIAGSTLVSEDLTCIVSGMMAGRGQLALPFAIAACAAGIFVGDVLLFLTGRWLVRPIVRAGARGGKRWAIDDERLASASEWLRDRGAIVVFISRFVPGTRLPLYTAAGVLDMPLPRFSLWLLAAVAAWTPLLVGVAALWGDAVDPAAFGLRATLLAGAVAIVVLLALELRAMSRKRTRLLLSRWHRLSRWEFWPAWLFYVPVALRIALLAVRHRSLLCFTAANPAMPAGGFVGESKHEILSALRGAREHLPSMRLVPAGDDTAARLSIVERFIAEEGLAFPVVLKPDAGQRGSGVVVARSLAECRGYLATFPGSVLAQEYVDGHELGVFYVRHPDEARGRIFAITDKRLLTLDGDGRRTLEELILDDARAVSMAPFHLERHAGRLREVPPAGEVVRLVDLGTHCRGALFLDGMPLLTDALEDAIERASRTYEGFYFGRYDVRGESIDAIRRGRFKILELNGVTSEATSIYDPKNGLLDAYRVLFDQWSLAFEIGAANVRRGHRAASLREIVTSLRSYSTLSRLHPVPGGLRANARPTGDVATSPYTETTRTTRSSNA
jgi:membrane protein DedA with SNARE-associated domain